MDKPSFTITATQALRTLFAVIGATGDEVNVEFARENGGTAVKYLDSSKAVLVATEVPLETPKDVAVTVADGRPTRWRKLKEIEFYDDGAVFVFPDGVERFDYETSLQLNYTIIEDVATRNDPITLDAKKLRAVEDFLKRAGKAGAKSVYIGFKKAQLAYRVGETTNVEVLDLGQELRNDRIAVAYGVRYLFPIIHEIRMLGPTTVKFYPFAEEGPLFIEARFKDGSELKVAIAPRIREEGVDEIIEYYKIYGEFPTKLGFVSERGEYYEELEEKVENADENLKRMADQVEERLVDDRNALEMAILELTPEEQEALKREYGMSMEDWYHAMKGAIEDLRNDLVKLSVHGAWTGSISPEKRYYRLVEGGTPPRDAFEKVWSEYMEGWRWAKEKINEAEAAIKAINKFMQSAKGSAYAKLKAFEDELARKMAERFYPQFEKNPSPRVFLPEIRKAARGEYWRIIPFEKFYEDVARKAVNLMVELAKRRAEKPAEEKPTVETPKECNEPRFISYEPRPDGGVRIKSINIGDRRKAKTSAWAKLVTHVDVEQRGGYAFEGEFLPYTREVDVPNGAWLVVSRADGSWRHPHNTIYLIHVRNGRLCIVEEVDWPDEELSFKERAAELINAPAEKAGKVEEKPITPSKPLKKPEEERPPEKQQPEPTPQEEGLRFIRTKLANAYEAEMKIQGFPGEKAPEKLIDDLARKVYTGGLQQVEAMVKVLSEAKRRAADLKLQKVLGKKPAEVVEFEKPEEEKPPEVEEKPKEEVRRVSVEDELREHALKIARTVTLNPEALIECLPIVELAHMVQEGRTDMRSAKEIIYFAIMDGKRPEVICKIDWSKILPKRGKLDLRLVEDKLLEQMEKILPAPVPAMGVPSVPPTKVEKEVERALPTPAPTPTPTAAKGRPPAWLERKLKEPKTVAEILYKGVDKWVRENRHRYPDLPGYQDALREHTYHTLMGMLRALEAKPDKRLADGVAIYLLKTEPDVLVTQGIHGLYKLAAGNVRYILRRWASEGDVAARTVLEFINNHPTIYHKSEPQLGVVKVSFDYVPGYISEPTLMYVFVMALAAMLRAVGIDPGSSMPWPINEIFKEFLRALTG